MNFQAPKLLLFILTLMMHTAAFAEEGLPLFWWKEGDFVNFGDYISFKMIERITGMAPRCYNKRTPNQDKKLLASGSIYYFANEGDVIWGSGVNGKRTNKNDYNFTSLDIRCVRGPITHHFLKENFNITTPEIYGDPALLFPYLFPEFQRKENPEHDYIILLHYLDLPYFFDSGEAPVIFATDPWDSIIRTILNSKFVITSSLHGLILAEAYGIPARLLRLSEHEPLLKFYDYYYGTGREGFNFATTVEEAILMQGEPPIQCDLEQIYHAFPFEFWPNQDFPIIHFTKEHIL